MHFSETDSIGTNIETAVLFASYGPRCLRVAKSLADADFRGEVVAFYCEDIKSDSVRKNLATFDRLLKKPCRKLPVSYHGPEAMIKNACTLNSRRSMLIDITCFNRENLFPFLWGLRMGIDAFPAVQFAYTAPNKYGTWLSRDYHTAHNIVGFGGGFDFARTRGLVCLVGFEANRALSVIETAEPSSVVLALGSIPTKDEFERRNREAVLEVLGSDRFEIREIDVKNPEKTLSDLTEIVESLDPYASIHVAPFNTKLSCLATYALWTHRPWIRIWNALPETYNLRAYSKGDSQPRYFDVDWSKQEQRAATRNSTIEVTDSHQAC